MLLELVIENYAVIERLRVRFHQGFNVLTGETGSGKSIVVDALGLLFGGRASADMLRSGAPRARISGIFEAGTRAGEILDAAGIETEDGEVLIEREILANGKSRAFVASRPVAAGLLRQLAPALGEIHGQHDQQELFSREVQLDLLDRFAGAEDLHAAVAAKYAEWRAAGNELQELERTEQERLRSLDVWTYQKNEIDSGHLKANEEEQLEGERRILQNVGKLLEHANAAYEALYDAPESASAQLRAGIRRVEDLSRIDEGLEPALDSLKSAQISIHEASDTLRHYLGKLEADPARLEEVESRLAAIGKLKRKYGTTIDEILAFAAGLDEKIGSAQTSSERRVALEAARARLASEYEDLGRRLSARRTQAATKLARKVQAELQTLAMERTTFVVSVTPGDWSASGIDRVEFLVSANTGEEPKPMDKIASGGELSRIALALKASVADVNQVARTLVFDEVDAGIGGVAAEAVGKRLKAIAARNQVLCVTHLAQIAGFADHHYGVSKQESKGRTVATIDELSGDIRTREIGRMLSGQQLTPEALKHAEQLIKAATKE